VSLLLHPAAAADVEEAFRWYEARRDGLGDEFLEVVQSGLESICCPAFHTLFSIG